MVDQRRVPVAEADPYLLFGLLGKQVIHPGGRRATEELFELGVLAAGQQVSGRRLWRGDDGHGDGEPVPRISRAVPYLGCVVIAGRRPDADAG